MEIKESKSFSRSNIDDRRLSILIFSLFFSWVLSFPFEGQVLYAVAQLHGFDPHDIVFGSIAATFIGLLTGGFFVRTILAAKRAFLFSIVLCMMVSGVFFFKPSILWGVSLISGAFLGGICVAAWGYYFKNGTPPNERIKTAASGLIYSNLLMIGINMAAIHVSPYLGLGLCLIVLAGALFLSAWLPSVEKQWTMIPSHSKIEGRPISILKPLSFLCLFIMIITINSGLMYQVINPAFEHHEWLVSWYWAVPYIVALFIMKNLPRKTNRTYILYVAIAMIGLAFLAFMSLDRSVMSYLIVDTLMLGACGVYDLFWWSILGEMLDWQKNAATILGMGLSANVLGVLVGGLIGNGIYSGELPDREASVLALVIVCITLIILPVLHKYLSGLLTDHAYLTVFSELSPSEHTKAIHGFTTIGKLTERESEIAALLLSGKTYRMIAGELSLSENTVKTHIKNIYSKYNIQSRMELIRIMLDQQHLNKKE